MIFSGFAVASSWLWCFLLKRSCEAPWDPIAIEVTVGCSALGTSCVLCSLMQKNLAVLRLGLGVEANSARGWAGGGKPCRMQLLNTIAPSCTSHLVVYRGSMAHGQWTYVSRAKHWWACQAQAVLCWKQSKPCGWGGAELLMNKERIGC